jgi:NitT/TauT family transport system ATP-binding protein
MCLAGLYGVDAGSVRFEQQAVSAPPPGLSVVFQDYSRSLLPWKNNLDNVLFGMKRTTLAEADKRQRAGELLVAVGLAGYEQHFPWQVSGGMQQRVAIARGLAAQSRLLLLEAHAAGVHPVEAGQAHQQGRLAAAARADDGDELARPRPTRSPWS